VNFTTLNVPGADGRFVAVEAAILRVTDNLLAVQKLPCDDGAVMYMALHVPTGGRITRIGFHCPDLARDALVSFWTRLDDDCRELLRGEEFVKSKAMRVAFQETWGASADAELVDEVPA